MNGEVRSYRVVGRAATKQATNSEVASYLPKILLSIVQEPGNYVCRFQIGDGEYFNAIKLYPGDITRLLSALETNTEYTLTNTGEIYDELPSDQTTRPRKTEGITGHVRPCTNNGLEIQLGTRDTYGAEAILTPNQRDDFEQVIQSFDNGQNGFTPLFDNGNPQLVEPDGEFHKILHSS